MRLPTGLIVGALLLSLYAAVASADDVSIHGRVVDPNGKPIPSAAVSEFWRANGNQKKADGTPFDLKDSKQLMDFWGRIGEMAPSGDHGVTADDGTFAVPIHYRSRSLFAMNAERTHGCIAALPAPEESQSIEIRLQPLVKVQGRMRSLVGEQKVDWTHVSVELPEEPSRPIANNRIVSCGSFESRFEFQLPPGTYVLDATGISDRDSEDIDLRVQSGPTFVIDGKQTEIDLGILDLTLAPKSRDLVADASRENRWRDFTKRYGEPAPDWHAIDARGINKTATIQDFRGKWLLIDFWSLNCVPCLGKDIPMLMHFYEKHASQRDKFEIISICLDFTEELSSMQQLEASMTKLEKHVWKDRKIPFPIVLDNTFQTCERFGIPGAGFLILIDPDGNLVEGDETTLARILAGGVEKSNTPKPGD